MIFSAGYTFKHHIADNETKIIVKIIKIQDGDTTIIEKKFDGMKDLHEGHKDQKQ